MSNSNTSILKIFIPPAVVLFGTCLTLNIMYGSPLLRIKNTDEKTQVKLFDYPIFSYEKK